MKGLLLRSLQGDVVIAVPLRCYSCLSCWAIGEANKVAAEADFPRRWARARGSGSGLMESGLRDAVKTKHHLTATIPGPKAIQKGKDDGGQIWAPLDPNFADGTTDVNVTGTIGETSGVNAT